jgi:outer membrane protein TolC
MSNRIMKNHINEYIHSKEYVRLLGVLSLAGVLFWVTGCAVGPKYRKPTIQIPAQYKEAAVPQSSAADSWKLAQPRDEVGRGKWWELFGDAQLNALEERVNVSNQTLKAAEAQYREARALVRADRASYYPTITANPSISVSKPSENRSFNSQTGTGGLAPARQLSTPCPGTSLTKRMFGAEFARPLTRAKPMLRQARQM